MIFQQIGQATVLSNSYLTHFSCNTCLHTVFLTVSFFKESRQTGQSPRACQVFMRTSDSWMGRTSNRSPLGGYAVNVLISILRDALGVTWCWLERFKYNINAMRQAIIERQMQPKKRIMRKMKKA